MERRRHSRGGWIGGAAYRLGEAIGWVAHRGVRTATGVRRPASVVIDPAMTDAAAAASALGLRGLASELSSPDPAARRAALQTVGELAEDRAARIVLAALRDPDAEVRAAAAAAAARARASAAVFSLILTLDDPAPEVRQTAAMAIEEIGLIRVDLPVHADAAARQRTIAELKQWWKRHRLAQLAGAAQERAR